MLENFIDLLKNKTPMNLIIQLLVYLKWKTINRQQVKNWQLTKNETMLIFTLKKGWYKERQLAAEILGQMRSKKAIIPLSKSCKDMNEKVAKTAIQALKNLPSTEQIRKVIKKAELYWQMQVAKKKGRHAFLKELKYSDLQMLDRYDKMQQLERVRQQLSRN